MYEPSSYSSTPERKRRHGVSSVPFLIILLLIALGAFGWSYYRYSQTSKQLEALIDPNVKTELDKAQTQALLEKIGRLIVIPKNEEPVVATINDIEALANEQNFYRDAENGQKLVIFYGVQKAIIYDEATNKLINVGPVFLKDEQGNDQPAPRVDGKLNIEIRNGSNDSHKGVATRDKLTTDSVYNLIRLSKSAKADYGDPIIVNLIGDQKSDLIKKLEEVMGVTAVREIPEGETPTDAEVLIIVGNNK
jgi:hypothetical protein